MCLNPGTPKNINFSYERNGKLMALGVPILKHFRVFMLKFCVNVFEIPIYFNVFVWVDVWHDNRYWSKVLFCTTPTHVCDLQVKSQTLILIRRPKGLGDIAMSLTSIFVSTL